MKKELKILFIGILFILIAAIGIVSAMTPALCKDADGYYNDCDIVYGYSNRGYYMDYPYQDSYSYGKLTYCRNDRGEYYYCYKKYRTYENNYDDYYANVNYYERYNDKYGNIIKITRPGYNREYCYWVNDGWNSRKVCYSVDDYQNNPYYPDYYRYIDMKGEEIMHPTIYVR